MSMGPSEIRAYMNKPLTLGEAARIETAGRPPEWMVTGGYFDGKPCCPGTGWEARTVLVAGEFLCPDCALRKWSRS